MKSQLHDAKLRLARAQLGVWRAKLRRLKGRLMLKADAVHYIEILRDGIKITSGAAAEALPRDAALDRLGAQLDAEAQDAIDEITNHLTAPDSGAEVDEQTNTGVDEDDSEQTND